jgi:hypothetical protein
MANFVRLTRVYILKADKTKKIKTQSITVNTDDISTVRVSNRLGYPEHRATLMLKSGLTIDLAETKDAVDAKMGVR